MSQSDLETYAAMERELHGIRARHGGESREEELHLSKMDDHWSKLSDEEKAFLSERMKLLEKTVIDVGRVCFYYRWQNIYIYDRGRIVLAKPLDEVEQQMRNGGADLVAKAIPDLCLADRTYVAKCLAALLMMAQGSAAMAPPAIPTHQERTGI